MEINSTIEDILISSVAVAVSTTISAIVLEDGRRHRSPPSRRYSSRISQWAEVQSKPYIYVGWYIEKFRCSRKSFDRIVELVQEQWNVVNEPPGHNAFFTIKDRVAVTLFFLTHAGSEAQSATVFGMGRVTAHRYIKQVVKVVVRCLSKKYIHLPKTKEEWRAKAQAFEKLCNFPNACSAIDGSLFDIERPVDYEGWYSRKGRPSFNVQVVVDAKKLFMSYSILPGSANDRTLFKKSIFGELIHQVLPVECHILGDAGYTQYQHLMTPYPIREEMPADEAFYNLLHSRTRIVVEGALGLLKSRFRIFKECLNQKSFKESADLIRSCIVLHNIILILGDETDVDVDQESREIIENDNNEDELGEKIDGILARQKRNMIKDYLYSNFKHQ